MPSPSAVPPAGLVAYNVVEAIDPAPEGCATPPNHSRCVQDRIWVVNADGSDPRPLLPTCGIHAGLAQTARALLFGDSSMVLSDLSGSIVETFATSLRAYREVPYVDGVSLSPTARIVYVLGDETEDLVSRSSTTAGSTRKSTRANGPIRRHSGESGANDAPSVAGRRSPSSDGHRAACRGWLLPDRIFSSVDGNPP
jgi:hypothetical protein